MGLIGQLPNQENRVDSDSLRSTGLIYPLVIQSMQVSFASLVAMLQLHQVGLPPAPGYMYIMELPPHLRGLAILLHARWRGQEVEAGLLDLGQYCGLKVLGVTRSSAMALQYSD